MRTRLIVGLAVAAVMLSGCGLPLLPGNTTTTVPKNSALVDFTGKGLQYAQDTAQAAGFKSLSSHDASGTGRHQILDRDWKVCFQSPKPTPSIPVNTKIDFAVVKVEETCPSTESTTSTTAKGQTAPAIMPDLVNKSAAEAEQLLGKSASITFKDALGGRSVIVPSNWKVCGQTPAAGEPFAGVPAALTVVKQTESCPVTKA